MEEVEETGKYTIGDRCSGFWWAYWDITVVVIAIFAFMPLMICSDFEPKFNCMYVVCIMTVCWLTEAIPIPITSMIPIFMFPILGIMNSLETCKMYLTDTNVMCIGCMMFAIALEFCNLHNRLAYGIMRKVGCSHLKLHAGFAAVTAFVSMWITNTAATAMMCPIIMAVLVELESQGLTKVYENRISSGSNANVNNPELEEDPLPSKLTVSYFLIVAYSSSIGGTATLIGSGTNIFMKGAFEASYPEGDLSYLLWFALFLPPMIINVMLVELGMQFQYFGLWRKNSPEAKMVLMNEESQKNVKDVINKKYEELGPISWHEWMVIIFFILMIIFFIFRDPIFMPGFTRLFNTHLLPKEQSAYVKDSTSVIFLFVLMFFIPKTLECLNFFKRDPEYLPTRGGQALLTWRFMRGRMPWGFLFLLGSGYALAKGGSVSGMNDYLGEKLMVLTSIPLIFLLLLILIFVKLLTEILSNVALVSLTLPVLQTMCERMHVNPYYLVMPATVVASYSFLLPVGTPPNALIREFAFIRNRQMTVGGLWPSIITVIVTWLMFIGYGTLVYPGLNQYPDWAHSRNRDNVNAFLLFLENLLNQTRRSGELRGQGFNLHDALHNISDFGLYSLNWGGRVHENITL